MEAFTKKNKNLKSIELSDKDLIARILSGERQLLNNLYDRYSGKIYHKCLSVTKDPELAKDLTHDIMIKVFLNLSSYSGKSDFSFWVYAITYNTCMSHFRKAKKIHMEVLDDEKEAQLATDDELTKKLLLEIKLDQLEQLLKLLKADDRLILLMRYQDAMSLKQISAVLDIGESAVKMRLQRSRAKLAELFKTLNDE